MNSPKCSNCEYNLHYICENNLYIPNPFGYLPCDSEYCYKDKNFTLPIIYFWDKYCKMEENKFISISKHEEFEKLKQQLKESIIND
jgi:hypothetical protein